jgi:hypothetical protein
MNSELKQRALTHNFTRRIIDNNISLCQIARCNKKASKHKQVGDETHN